MTDGRAASAVFAGMLDAQDRVRGRVGYAINVELPNMLWGRLLRSTKPHARIVRVDVSRARAVPGVRAVITGEDIARRTDLNPYFGPVFPDQPPLAMGRVRYVGEPVVAVAADDLDAADEALDLVEVEYEDLPAVFDVLEALKDGAPLVQPDPPKIPDSFADIILHMHPGTNICNQFKLRRGDVERGFDEADEIFEETYGNPSAQHVSLETHACVVHVEGDRITVWSGNQTPHLLRNQIAGIFRRPSATVRVRVPTLGGGYGGKCYAQMEPAAALLSEMTRRPVKMHLRREEEFVTVTKHACVVKMKTGLKRDGTIVARQNSLYYNTGSYALIGPRVIKNGGYASVGPYRIPNVWVDSYAVYTNLPSAGSFRGFGVAQAAWAYESHTDMLAE